MSSLSLSAEFYLDFRYFVYIGAAVSVRHCRLEATHHFWFLQYSTSSSS